jgi:7-carboxy-7-deazaguanine synthase
MQVHEIFYSIQGEGPNQGLPTIFVRTQGCTVGCRACDTTYSWYPRAGFTMGPGDIMSRVSTVGGDCRRLCITGGEPLDQMEEVEALVQLATRVWGYEVELETSGCIEINPEWPCRYILDIKTPSSGVEDKWVEKNLEYLFAKDSIVAVIADKEDWKYVTEILLRQKCWLPPVYFHPDWYVEDRAALMRDMVEWLKKAGQSNWRLGFQLHKLIWGGEARGV